MTSAYSTAVALLSQREYTTQALERKLRQRGHTAEDVIAAMNQLKSAGLQSDARFAESYARQRAERGYGRVRIKEELKQHGIHEDTITETIRCTDMNWIDNARRVLIKKYTEAVWSQTMLQPKQKNFLLYRGFTIDEIQAAWRQRSQ